MGVLSASGIRGENHGSWHLLIEHESHALRLCIWLDLLRLTQKLFLMGSPQNTATKPDWRWRLPPVMKAWQLNIGHPFNRLQARH